MSEEEKKKKKKKKKILIFIWLKQYTMQNYIIPLIVSHLIWQVAIL